MKHLVARRSSVRLIAFALLTALLAASLTACTMGKRSNEPINAATLATRSAEDLIKQAQDYDYPNAATLLFAAVSRATSEKRADLIDVALKQLASLPLNQPDQYRKRLAEIQRERLHAGADAALKLAGKLPPPPDNETRAQAADLKADLYESAKQPYLGARERMYALPLLSGEARTAQAKKLWSSLSAAPFNALVSAAKKTLDPREGAWVDLGLILFGSASADEQVRRIGAWQQRYRNFVLASDLPDEVGALPQQAAHQLQAIALLLPLSGELGAAGRAIRDGFFAAMLASNPNDTPRITLVDTNGRSMAEALRSAQLAGADLIVGPLDRGQVADLSGQTALNVPTLALNYAPAATSNPNVYQFGLAPEDEALAAISQAFADGKRNLIVVQSTADWSQRAAEASVQRWKELGGVLMSRLRLGKLSDLTATLNSISKISDPTARAASLATALGLSTSFHEHQRTQVDAVLLLLARNEARALAPQFKSYFNASAAQYGISPLLGDRDSQHVGSELDGVWVYDTPWRLGIGDRLLSEVAQFWPGARGSTANLYALGVDAFQLQSRLSSLQNASLKLRGASGSLSMAGHRVVRVPASARIEHGAAVSQ